ncbi:sorbitol dehydrogenase [Rhizodiscina lignyota]|uniref:D-xylulose reductase n=1 Tax=Rhizodiscina lignyota TaxID=1504668 RepID=A0A9P4MCB4_9PEZI|nr:sorbitol dehydrogenase [Rhizodiscina lignyota]
MHNASCVLYGPGSIQFEDREIPQLCDEHDIIVRIAYVGVCGSDVHFWKHGGIRTMVDPQKGIIMGHEACGIVHSKGKAVKSVELGDHVAIEPGIPCRRCKNCKDGQYNLCKAVKFAAAPPDSHGTLTKFFRIPEDFVYRIPPDIPLEEIVIVEPLSVAVHAVRLVDIRPGETVVVMGSGTIGLLCGAVAKAFGASQIILVDIIDRKLEFAEQFLPCQTFKPLSNASPEENAAALNKAFGIDDGVDVVIEASGAATSIQTGIHVLKSGGKYVQTGLGKPNVEVPILTLSEKELLVRGCFRYGSGDFELAASMLVKRQLDFKSLISSISTFEHVVDAWEKTARGEGVKNLIKVQD